MENILIIGNGFDLYHGLPTRYTDFLSFVEFWNHFKEKYNLNSSKSKDESDGFIIRLGENGTIIEESMEDFASYRLCFDSEKIEYLDKYLQKNAWIKYFINTKYKKEGWIDFESEMEKVLLVIDKLTSHTKDYYTNNTAYSLMINEKPSYIECFEEKIEGNGFLFEKINTNKDHLNEYRKELLKCMKNEMEVLNKCLRIYLSEFVSKIKIRDYSKQIEGLLYSFNGKEKQEEFKILNFNYTHTYQKCYNPIDIFGIPINMHFVHGDLNVYADDNSTGLVLGISDQSELSDDFIYFKKFFQRIQKRTGTNYRHWINDIFKEKDTAFHVHIFGHSLDVTDKGILDYFFTNESVKKVLIYYNDQKSYERQVINLVKMYGKDTIIEEIANDKICFVQIEKSIPIDIISRK